MLKKAAVIVGVLALSACGSESATTPSPTPTPSASVTAPVEPAKLTVGVWGSEPELAAWGQVVANYNAGTDMADVTLTTWNDAAAATTALADPNQPLPDVFLMSRADLDQLDENKRVAPVDEYLDARAVDIGDEYSRDALEALTKNKRLECMPYGVSLNVVYYNTDLVDFPRMAAKGIEVPNITSSKSWSWDEFQLAAQEVATQVKEDPAMAQVRPFAVTPTLAGLAPFILSAGGELTTEGDVSLAISSDDDLDALDEILPVLANPELTTKASQAKQVRWFSEGKLAMMVADRSVVPTLRSNPNLRFDVLPIPTINQAATTGDYTALCISASSSNLEAAADLLVGLSSVDGVTPLAETGAIIPVNQQVALSQAFVQADEEPLHSSVFTRAVRTMKVLPLTNEWAALEAATAEEVAKLFIPGQLPVTIKQAATAIDATSATLLAPLNAEKRASASASPTE